MTTGLPRVKVCGLTRIEDAELAVALGASAVGFVFWPRSPRVVDIARAAAIARALPPFVTRVGVFVDARADEIAATAEAVGLDAAQLHGDERVDDCAALGVRLLRVVTLEAASDMDAAVALPPHVTPLVDASDRVRRGGTGQRADWARAADLAARRRIVLAGGLTAENVGDAIRRVRPWALDVSSGVEEAPGVKSAGRLRAFFDRVREAAGASAPVAAVSPARMEEL